MPKILKSLGLAGLLLLVVPARAATPADDTSTDQPPELHHYRVELIVFRNTDPGAGDEETWPLNPGRPAVDKAADPLSAIAGGDDTASPPASETTTRGLNTTDRAGVVPAQSTADPTAAGTVTPQPPAPLDPGDYQLSGVEQELQSSGHYQVVLHSGWTETLSDRDEGTVRLHLPVTSTADKPATGTAATGPGIDSGSLMPSDDRLALTPANTAPGDVALPVSPLMRPLDGIVTLSRSRFLHLDLDLVYRPADASPAHVQGGEDQRSAVLDALIHGQLSQEQAEALFNQGQSEAFLGYRMNQSRRIRPGDLNYFDHPVFGVVALVTEVQPPSETTPSGGSDASSGSVVPGQPGQ
ncbi:MAG: CsiV family protein [Gammaproteobacteria bacterium]